MYAEKYGLWLSEGCLQALRDGRFDLLRKVDAGNGRTVVALNDKGVACGRYPSEMVLLGVPNQAPERFALV